MPHGVIGHGTQSLCSNGGFSYQKHAAGIAMPTVFDDGNVNVHNVTLFEGFFVGNAVTHLVVDGGADRFGVGRITRRLVIQRGGNGALNIDHVVMGQLVQLVGGNAWHHEGGQVV